MKKRDQHIATFITVVVIIFLLGIINFLGNLIEYIMEFNVAKIILGIIVMFVLYHLVKFIIKKIKIQYKKENQINSFKKGCER